MILTARDLVTGYGLGAVIHGVSVDVDAAEVVCLLGRNGAGKSTTLRSVMGLTPPREGQSNSWVRRSPAASLSRSRGRGIGYIPDDRRIFADLTVEENLRIVRQVMRRDGRWTLDRVLQLFPALAELRSKAVPDSRAASRRCSRSAARSWAIPCCSSSTSRPRA